MTNWPQLIFLGLYALSILVALVKHGEVKVEQYNAYKTILAVAIGAAVLWWGGFWAPLGL